MVTLLEIALTFVSSAYYHILLQALSIRYYKSAVFAYINAQQSEALVRALGLSSETLPAFYKLDLKSGKMQPLKGALDDRHILENTVLEQTGAKRVGAYSRASESSFMFLRLVLDIYGRELKASEQNNKEDL